MIIRKISRTNRDAKKRVAAYCRVSTDREEQEESYERQVDYYERFIRGNSEWEYAGIYADHGRSGTNVKGRPGFQELLRDALGEGQGRRNGKIDIILVKSISRFSRNMVDCDRIVRELKAAGVEVRFEKENISSFDASAGFVFSLLAAVAQDESRSISENVRWGYANRFKNGQYNLGNNRIFGYDSVDGKLVPNKDASAVRRMFELFAQGKGYAEIARILNAEGVRRMRSGNLVSVSMIQIILRNETYVGDKRLQKQPPINFLTKKPDLNVEHVSYYLKDDHEGIVDRETWDKVQTMLRQKKEEVDAGIYKRNNQHPLYGKLYCGQCGAPYRRRTLRECPARGGGQYKAWNCRERQMGVKGNGCKNRTVREEWLMEEIRRITRKEGFDHIERVEVFEDGIEVKERTMDILIH